MAALLAVLRFEAIPVGSFFDDAHYIVLSESLSHGSGYHLINYPHAPTETAFPPGWPLLLMPIAGFFPTNFTLLKLPSLLFFLGSILLAFRLFQRQFRPPYLYLLLGLIAVNVSLVGMATTVMSESAFLFWCLLTLLLYERWREDMQKRRLWLLGVVILTAVFTLMIRSVGIALLAGILLHLLLNLPRQQRRALFIGLAALLLVGIPLAWFNVRNGGMLFFSELYTVHIRYIASEFGSFVRVWQHVELLSPETLANAVVPIFELGTVQNLLGIQLTRLLAVSVLLLVLLGFALSLRSYRAQDLYFLAYVAIFYLWVVYIQEVQPRIVIPLIPWLYAYLIVAVRWLNGRLPTKLSAKTRGAIPMLFGVLLLVVLLFNGQALRVPIAERVVDLRTGNSWLAQNAPAESIVMSPNPVADYLYGRRQTVNYPRNQEDITAYIEATGVDYVLIHPPLEFWDLQELDPYMLETLLPHLATDSEKFEEVFRDDSQNVLLYAVRK